MSVVSLIEILVSDDRQFGVVGKGTCTKSGDVYVGQVPGVIERLCPLRSRQCPILIFYLSEYEG